MTAIRSKNSNLIPIRIDCSCPSIDNTTNIDLRIIDTLLFDPTVWPIPLTTTTASSTSINTNNSNDYKELLINSIKDNCIYITNNILNDYEVININRTITTKQYTGQRYDLYTTIMYKEIYNQLYTQLLSIAYGQYYTTITKPNNYNKVPRSILLQQSTTITVNKNNKRTLSELQQQQQQQGEDDNDNYDNKRQKLSSSSSLSSSVPLPSTALIGSTTTNTGISSSSTTTTTTTTLLKIQLRLTVPGGIRIHDEFYYDTSTTELLSPIEIAYTIGYDLQLNNEIIQLIAIEISEQIQLQMQKKKQQQQSISSTSMTKDNNTANDDEEYETIVLNSMFSPIKNKNYINTTTAAWYIDPKLYNNHIQYFASTLLSVQEQQQQNNPVQVQIPKPVQAQVQNQQQVVQTKIQ